MPTNLTGLLATQYSQLGRVVLGAAQVAWQRSSSASDSATFTDTASKQGEHVVVAADSATFTDIASVHGIHVASSADSAIMQGVAVGYQDDPVSAISSAAFMSSVVGTVLRGKYAADSATFTGLAFAGDEIPASAASTVTFTCSASSSVLRAASASDSATFTDTASDHEIHSAHDAASFIGTASSSVVHHASAADSATFTGIGDGFDPYLHEFAVDAAAFTDISSASLHHGKLGMDTATFSEVASVVVYLGRHRRGDKVILSIVTPSTPDAPPIAVILDGTNTQMAAIMMPATNQPRTSFRLALQIGLTYSIGSFTVFFHYTIAGTSTLQQASFDVIPGGDSGGSVIALYSLDRVEARCIVAQLDSGVLVLGKTPTVQA